MKNEIKAHVSEEFETGAILFSCGGWEQTNINFYVVIKRSGMFVTILPMKKKVDYDSMSMTGKNLPAEIDYSAAPIRKKIQMYEGKEYGFAFGNYTGADYCKLWDGSVKISSHYA